MANGIVKALALSNPLNSSTQCCIFLGHTLMKLNLSIIPQK
jgi:hypothetical protein